MPQFRINPYERKPSAESSIRTAAASLPLWWDWLAERGLLLPSEVTTEVLAAYVMSRAETVTRATIEKDLAIVRRWGALFNLDLRSVPLPKRMPQMHRRRILSSEDIDKLYRRIGGHHLETGVYLSLEAGLRVHECRALRWVNVSLGTGELHVRTTKSRGTRIVAITARLHRHLADLDRANMARKERRRHIHVWPAKDGTERRQNPPLHFTVGGRSIGGWHNLRRTFCTMLYRGGMTVEEIAMIAGHDNTETTMQYIYDQPDSAAIDKALARARDLARMAR